MHHKQTRPDPNVADPLSEPTLNRRLWAAYRQRGYTRASFARAMGMTYAGLDGWDTGVKTPQLAGLMRAAELVGYSLDQLAYGKTPPSAKRVESELSRDAMKSLLAELRASTEQIEALGEYERSAAGQYQRFTRSYVAAFLECFAAVRASDASIDVKRAIIAAKEAGANARANAEAIALQLAHSPSAAELAALGAQLEVDGEPIVVAPAVRAVAVSSRKLKRKKRA